jgi:hypothetical protein
VTPTKRGAADENLRLKAMAQRRLRASGCRRSRAPTSRPTVMSD